MEIVLNRWYVQGEPDGAISGDFLEDLCVHIL